MVGFEEVSLTGNRAPNDLTLLIDADTILFATCSVLETEDLHPNFPCERYEEDRYTIDLEEVVATILDKISYMKKRTGCQEVELYLTGDNNFRYEIYPEYKGNRANTRRPEGLKEVKLLLMERYENVRTIEGTEADDIVCYLKRQTPEKFMLSSIDKDVLNACPGEHYNYNKDEFLVVEESYARYWPYFQCITGDTTDNIKGAKGLGPKKAPLFISEEMDEKELWQGVLAAYEKTGQSVEDAILNMRLVHMHQWNGEQVVLWEPPEG